MKAAFLVATHHRPQLLRACLDSLQQQQGIPDGWDVEILVAGEAEDPGKEVAAEADVPYQVVADPKVTVKLNALVARTDAELVMLADDDDLQPPNRAAASIQAFLEGYEWSGTRNCYFYDMIHDCVTFWKGDKDGLVGTSMSYTTKLLREIRGWPPIPNGKDAKAAYRIRRLPRKPAHKDITSLLEGMPVCLQHGENIWDRPVLESERSMVRGRFIVTGKGNRATWAESEAKELLRRGLGVLDGTWVAPNPPKEAPKKISATPQVITPRPPPILVPQGNVPLTCVPGGAGQQAFTDGLLSIGFKAVSRAEADEALRSGQPVLFHGWWTGARKLCAYYPKLAHILWHSGFAGSDLMGEGGTLSEALRMSASGQGRFLWLETRDVLPVGATRMVPVWDSQRLQSLGRAPKKPGSVMVGFCGHYPSNAKNILACVAGATQTSGHLHLSTSSTLELRGAAVQALLVAAQSWKTYGVLSRGAAVKLVSSMDVMIHTSLSDTWPYLVMEAIYAGTPVVLCDTIRWVKDLPKWAQELCCVRPAIASDEIRRLTQHLLDHPADRIKLLHAQRELLDRLSLQYKAEATDILQGLGFPMMPQEPVPAAVTAPALSLSTPALVNPPVHPIRVNPPAHPAKESEMANGKQDLQNFVTVFVISSGEPSTPTCHKHLDNQDSLFLREDIRNVAPMWRAFQQMMDRCQTPYYVQIDADMLLDPSAIRRLYEKITTTKAAQYVGWLWDDDVHRPIQGVKIYNHAICKQYPYKEALSCEMGQNELLRTNGHEIVADNSPGRVRKETNGVWTEEYTRTAEIFGTHLASQTPEMAFVRWKRLMQKHRKLSWMGWLSKYPQMLMQEWLAEPGNEIRQAKFLGATVGLTGEQPEDKEMDFRAADQDYRRLASYVGEFSHGPREMTLYLTDKCNFKCVFGTTPCKRQTPEGVPQQGDITPATLTTALNRYPTIRGCCIAGFGEPLLHPQLPELIRICGSHKVVVGLITNGSLLWKNAAELQGLPISYLSVSLNATTAEEHQATTRTDFWLKVLEGIRLMSASPIRSGVSYVVTNSNAHRIPALLALAKELRVQFVHLINVLPHNGPLDKDFLNDVLTPRSDKALAEIAHAKTCPGAELVEVWPEVILGPEGAPGKCMSPMVSLGLDAKGAISGCRRIDPPSESSGNIRLGGTWQNNHYAQLRLSVTGDQPNAHPACQGCFGNWKG